MCYWVGTKKVREEMIRRYKEGPQDEIAQLFYETFIVNNNMDYKEQYVAIGKGKPVLTTLIKESGKMQFRNMQWTLPYSYQDSKTNSIVKRELLNSTCERLFFQHKELIFKQRCIVPIDGYFEYYHLNGETYPYYIYPKEGGLFYAGGIWGRKVDEGTGEIWESFSIITTSPNPMVARIHNNPKAPNGSRMLLLVPEDKTKSYLDENLQTKEIKEFFTPFDADKMNAHPVIRFQRKEFAQFVNTPKVLERCEYPELVA